MLTRESVGQIAQLPRRYWTRGEPGRPTPGALNWGLYQLWLVALLLKMLGSTWDVSWHFRWLRDDLAPPHLLNTAGTALAVALLLVHTYTGYGVDRLTLRIMQWGMGIFLVAAPLDVINHRINGLDITSWSPSHALLYLGTAILIAGLIRGWHYNSRDGILAAAGVTERYRLLVLGALWLFFFENVFFPAQHQEYGVLEIVSWDQGAPYAEPSLLQFAADELGRPVDRVALVNFSLPVPAWVYPVWGCAAALAVLVMARGMIKWRWAATAIATTYVAYRGVSCLVLWGTGFPPSVLPFFLIAGGLAIDAVFLLSRSGRHQAVTGAILVTCSGYLALLIQDLFNLAPPVAYWSAPIAAVCLASLWFLTRYGGTGQDDSNPVGEAHNSKFEPSPPQQGTGLTLADSGK